MIPFARMIKYGNVKGLPEALVYLPMVNDFTNHGDSTNPLYSSVGLTVISATHGTIDGRTGLLCNGSQRIYYDEVVYADSSWSVSNWVYTTSTANKAYINASSNVGFSYNSGGNPNLVRNFYCVNSGSSTIAYYGSYSMPVGSWVHAVYTYDRDAKSLKFYANGELKRTQTVPTFSSYGTGGSTGRMVGLGYYPGNISSTPLNGYISHHRLYRSVLSDEDVMLIYNYELGGAE